MPVHAGQRPTAATPPGRLVVTTALVGASSDAYACTARRRPGRARSTAGSPTPRAPKSMTTLGARRRPEVPASRVPSIHARPVVVPGRRQSSRPAARRRPSMPVPRSTIASRTSSSPGPACPARCPSAPSARRVDGVPGAHERRGSSASASGSKRFVPVGVDPGGHQHHRPAKGSVADALAQRQRHRQRRGTCPASPGSGAASLFGLAGSPSHSRHPRHEVRPRAGTAVDGAELGHRASPPRSAHCGCCPASRRRTRAASTSTWSGCICTPVRLARADPPDCRRDPDPVARLLAAPPDLPVVAGLAASAALRTRGVAVVQAPPGTGKTTLVPPAVALLVGATGDRVVVTQPRRIAARAAAHGCAHLLGEPVGRTVGYTVRGDRRTGAATRIEVVTTGVLLRRLQRDPALPGVGGRRPRRGARATARRRPGPRAAASTSARNLRDDLLLVAMSATVEAARTAPCWATPRSSTSPAALHPVGRGLVPAAHRGAPVRRARRDAGLPRPRRRHRPPGAGRAAR